jgi:hypothetical protein
MGVCEIAGATAPLEIVARVHSTTSSPIIIIVAPIRSCCTHSQEIICNNLIQMRTFGYVIKTGSYGVIRNGNWGHSKAAACLVIFLPACLRYLHYIYIFVKKTKFSQHMGKIFCCHQFQIVYAGLNIKSGLNIMKFSSENGFYVAIPAIIEIKQDEV